MITTVTCDAERDLFLATAKFFVGNTHLTAASRVTYTRDTGCC